MQRKSVRKVSPCPHVPCQFVYAKMSVAEGGSDLFGIERRRGWKTFSQRAGGGTSYQLTQGEPYLVVLTLLTVWDDTKIAKGIRLKVELETSSLDLKGFLVSAMCLLGFTRLRLF